MGVAAATIGLVPALADSGDPDLPKITAQQLIEKIAKSDVQQLSGTVKISTDLGLPDLGGLESSLMSGAASPDGGGSSADPTAKLTELASGTHTLRVAADGPDKQKLSLLENAAEYSIVHNGKDVWAYDSKSNEVHHGTASESGKASENGKDQQPPATPKDFAEEALKAARRHDLRDRRTAPPRSPAGTPTSCSSSRSSPARPSVRSPWPWTRRRARR